MNKLLIICGPTATGKTGLGLKLAEKFKGQIISADSRQVYLGMDIGTGKDLHLINSIKGIGIKVWGYDLVKPDQDFSLAHFVKFARPLIKKIQAQNQLPILIGGTGLYLQAITQPIKTINIPPDPKLRQKLSGLTVKQLQAKLKKLNPDRFNSMNHSDQHNPRRLIRAIEIQKSKPKKPSPPQLSLDVLWLGLTAPKSVLDERVVKRVEERIQLGAEQEISRLLDAGYTWDLPAMSAMGYKQWQPYFASQASLKDVKQAWIKAEQQYLRRQLTWFKKQPDIHWFDISQRSLYQKLARKVAAWYTNK